MREVVVYSRRGCHLCDEMLVSAEPLCRGRAQLIVRDVDTNPAWTDAYGLDVPVLFVDGAEVCRHRLDESAFRAALSGAES